MTELAPRQGLRLLGITGAEPTNRAARAALLEPSVTLCRGAPRDPSRPKSGRAQVTLAARHRVGHIGGYGDMAEWLKAAVC